MPERVPTPADPPAARVEVPVTTERAELVAAALWASGALGVWERADHLVAWFRAADGASVDGDPQAGLGVDASAALGAAPPPVPELDPGRVRWSVEEDRDWQEEWKATIAPVRAGRVVVVPTWLAASHQPGDDERTLVLDPGRAFGSGHHATTTLCLELLDAIDRDEGLAGRSVADIGCGTGVLAIAAAAAGARAVALDIDPTAVEVARENAERNGVEVVAVTGSVDALTGPVEIVVANLVTDVVVSLARPLVAAADRTLIVSGIASERRERALDALVAAGARPEEVRERDGWVAARLTTTATTTGASTATTSATASGRATRAEGVTDPGAAS